MTSRTWKVFLSKPGSQNYWKYASGYVNMLLNYWKYASGYTRFKQWYPSLSRIIAVGVRNMFLKIALIMKI